MQIDLSSESIEQWKSVKLNDSEFEVLVKPATFEERCADADRFSMSTSAHSDWLESRIRAAITNWRGLESPDGQPIPFSWKTLSTLCTRFPSVFAQLVTYTHWAFRETSEEASKN